RRLQFHPVFSERMLDCLVLADRTIEDDARPGIATGARQREVAKANSFRGNQDALRIHAVQDVFETATLFAKTILDRYLEILEEQFVGIDRLAAHLLDLVHRDAAAIEIGVEQAQSVGRTLHLFERGGARQQEDLLRDLRGRDPDLLAVDNVPVALARGPGLELRGIETGVR